MTLQQLYEEALKFSQDKHRGQVRKYTGAAYLEHCIAVAGMVKARGGSPEVVAAALLHDTLEDTDATYDDLVKLFGSNVAEIVLELTDHYTKGRYPELNRKQRKNLEAARLARISQSAKLIKLCDLIDNTTSIVEHDPDFAVTYLREKAAVLEAMGYGE